MAKRLFLVSLICILLLPVVYSYPSYSNGNQTNGTTLLGHQVWVAINWSGGTSTSDSSIVAGKDVYIDESSVDTNWGYITHYFSSRPQQNNEFYCGLI